MEVSEEAGMKLAARVATEVMGWREGEAHFDPEMPASLWWFDANDERQHRMSLWRPDLNVAQAMDVVDVVLARLEELRGPPHFTLDIDSDGRPYARFSVPSITGSPSEWYGYGHTWAAAIVDASLKAAEAWK